MFHLVGLGVGGLGWWGGGGTLRGSDQLSSFGEARAPLRFSLLMHWRRR